MSIKDFVADEGRYAMLARANPEHARVLLELAQADVDERWRYYEQLAAVERSMPVASPAAADAEAAEGGVE
jgi:pyruvate-ferredoxin/flavodoxin oxidoreductase